MSLLPLAPTQATAAQEHLEHHIQMHKKLNMVFIDAQADFGCAADFETDDYDPLQDAIDSLGQELTHGAAGGTIYLPRGGYASRRQLDVDGLGIMVDGAGTYSTVLVPLPGFSGAANGESLPSMLRFKHPTGAAHHEAVGVSNLRIDMGNIDGHGITMMKAYDRVNLWRTDVRNVANTSNCYRFIPDPDESNKVSQGLELHNTTGKHANAAATAATYHFDNVHETNLYNVKGWGGPTNATVSVPFHYIDCRGVSMYGGAAALSANEGVKVTTSTKASQGLFFHGLTLEAVGKFLTATGAASRTISQLYWGPTRKDGTILGGFDLDYVEASEFITKNQPVTELATCSQNKILTNDRDIVSSLGANTSVQEWANANHREVWFNKLTSDQFRFVRYSTAQRPSASSLGQGTTILDTTLNVLLISDGTNWRDSAGNVVP